MKISFQKISIFFLAASMLSTSGCISHLKRSTVSMAENTTGQTLGTLFVWDSDVSAAIFYPKGSTCIQRALTTKDIKASGALTDAIFKLTNELTTTDDPKEREILSAAIAQTSTLLTTTTERTAFLDTGLFYLCQLGANQTLSDSEVITLSQQLIKSAAELEANKVTTVINKNNTLPLVVEPTQPIVPIQPNPPTAP